jgi:hypothetical protein
VPFLPRLRLDDRSGIKMGDEGREIGNPVELTTAIAYN